MHQQFAHGIFRLTGGVETGIEDGAITAEMLFVLAGRLTGQRLVALIAGGEKQPEPAVGVGGGTPLQDAVVADCLRITLLVPSGASHLFQRPVRNGTELARCAGSQRPLAIAMPKSHRNQIVEHLAIICLSIKGIQPRYGSLKLPRPSLDDPGFAGIVHPTGPCQ